MKKTIATLLAVLMILGLAACGGSTDTAPYSKDVEIAQSKTISYYEANKTLTDWWEVMALVAAGVDVKKEGYTLPELDGAEILTSQSPTALAKTILALYSIGENPRTYFAEGDLVEALEALQQANGQFGVYTNEQIYAIIGLESARSDKYDKDAAFVHLCSLEHEGGGFSYDGANIDPDLTAMSLLALRFYKENNEVSAVAQRVIAWLSDNMNEDGTYTSIWEPGAQPSDSVSSAISGLVSYGVDMSSEPYIKLVNSLLSHQLSNGDLRMKRAKPRLISTQPIRPCLRCRI